MVNIIPTLILFLQYNKLKIVQTINFYFYYRPPPPYVNRQSYDPKFNTKTEYIRLNQVSLVNLIVNNSWMILRL